MANQSGVHLIETKAHGGRVTIENGHILVNGRAPEKNFIAQTLKNTYWLRDKLLEETGKKIWITPLIVFTNAFVVSVAPVKGVRVINKKYLLRTIQKPNQKRKNLVVWDERDRLSEALQVPTVT